MDNNDFLKAVLFEVMDRLYQKCDTFRVSMLKTAICITTSYYKKNKYAFFVSPNKKIDLLSYSYSKGKQKLLSKEFGIPFDNSIDAADYIMETIEKWLEKS